jgi:hypothetical protein
VLCENLLYCESVIEENAGYDDEKDNE